LPANAHTLALGVVANHTTQPNLDVVMQRQLRHAALRDPNLRLTATQQGDLVVEVDLTRLDVSRFRDLTSTNSFAYSYNLAATVTLRDNRTQKVLLLNQPVTAMARLDFTESTAETPAVQNQGLDEATRNLAQQILDLVLAQP